MNTEILAIQKSQLTAFFENWENAFREGECLTPEELAELSVKEVVTLNVDFLWEHLKNTATTTEA